MNYITFSRNIFIPVSNICRNECGYCVFRARGREDAYLIGMQDFLNLLQDKGAATEVLFSAGEMPELAYQDLASLIKTKIRPGLPGDRSFSLVQYTKELCKLAIKYGLLPHSNLGLMSRDELMELREVNASMGLMLETTAGLRLEAHRRSPGKDPSLRLQMIEEAGKLEIPFTTGILVGIGEDKEDRIRSLEVIESLHEQYGHIQEVIIQPFVPKRSTMMGKNEPPSFEVMKETVRIARRILHEEIAIQVPPNLIAQLKELIEIGASDLGGISERTIDYINPESPWPREREIAYEIAPFKLRERLPIYPRYIEKGWYSEEIGRLIENFVNPEL